jgi:hypothetical protein
MGNIGVVRPILEAAATPVEEINDRKSLPGGELGREIYAVWHVAVQGSRVKCHVPHSYAGSLPRIVREDLRRLAAASEKHGDDSEGEPCYVRDALFLHGRYDSNSLLPAGMYTDC